jgi:hypothetical protein
MGQLVPLQLVPAMLRGRRRDAGGRGPREQVEEGSGRRASDRQLQQRAQQGPGRAAPVGLSLPGVRLVT